MNWDAIGAIGEIIGAAAVVVTLALLIAQLRYNSKAIQNAAMQTGMATNNQIVSPLFENEQLFELYDRGMRFPDELSISSKHAQIFFRDDHFYLQDLGSKTGTFLLMRGITKMNNETYIQLSPDT